MLDFEKLKKTLEEELKDLQSRLLITKRELSNLRNIKSVIGNSVGTSNEINYHKLFQLRDQFPQAEELYQMLEKIDKHQKELAYKPFENFDFDAFISDVRECAKLYSFPPKEMIDFLCRNNEAMVLAKGTLQSDFHIKHIKMAIKEVILPNIKEKIDVIRGYLANKIMECIVEEIKDLDEVSLAKEIENIKERIKVIDQFNNKFSKETLLSKFESEEELESFKNIIKSLLNPNDCEEIIKMVLEIQNKEEIKVVRIDFDNLDMSMFTDKEVEIIEEIREIIENEELGKENSIFSDEVTFANRFETYQNASIKDILLDINNCILNHIYDNKEEVIKIFEYAIKLYRKNTIRIIRENRYNELLRIRDDFLNIVSFINRTYLNKEKAYNEEQQIMRYVNSLNNEYLPTFEELINIDYQDDEDYDDMLDKIIVNYKSEIRKWKKVMTAYYKNDTEEEDIKENTDNLVFCITDDIDLDEDGYQNEFKGTIAQLEVKSSMELKRISGRKGMGKIWKSTDTHKRKDFIKYLEQKKKIKLHFTPYRYSSDGNYRTGVIKFETSSIVKEFLEKRYGLSKQSAYYGIFEVISAVHANHNDYSYLEGYIMDHYLEIEELARLMISEKPDFDLLQEKIDSMLNIKKDKLKMINSSNIK